MGKQNDYPSDAQLLQFISQIEKESLQKAPDNLKERILIAADSMEVQVAKKTRELSASTQLFLYSLKVCTAVVCVLLLLSLSDHASGFTADYRVQSYVPKTEVASILDRQGERLGDKLHSVTSKIMDFNVNLSD